MQTVLLLLLLSTALPACLAAATVPTTLRSRSLLAEQGQPLVCQRTHRRFPHLPRRKGPAGPNRLSIPSAQSTAMSPALSSATLSTQPWQDAAQPTESAQIANALDIGETPQTRNRLLTTAPPILVGLCPVPLVSPSDTLALNQEEGITPSPQAGAAGGIKEEKTTADCGRYRDRHHTDGLTHVQVCQRGGATCLQDGVGCYAVDLTTFAERLGQPRLPIAARVRSPDGSLLCMALLHLQPGKRTTTETQNNSLEAAFAA
jgi:hypothetical protein